MLKNKVESSKKIKKAPSVKEIEKPQPSVHAESEEESEN